MTEEIKNALGSLVYMSMMARGHAGDVFKEFSASVTDARSALLKGEKLRPALESMIRIAKLANGERNSNKHWLGNSIIIETAEKACGVSGT